jgi:hypothetical protein
MCLECKAHEERIARTATLAEQDRAKILVNQCYSVLLAKREGTFRWDSTVSLRIIDEEFGKLQESLRQQAGEQE